MQTEFQYIEPRKLIDLWPTIKIGLEIVAEKAPGGWTSEDVFMSLITGGSTLHLVIVDKYYQGFLVSQRIDTFQGQKILLWIGYSKAEGSDLLIDNVDKIMEWAKNIGAVCVQFQSPRKGWGRVAKKLGFNPTQVIYERKTEKD